MSEDEASGGLEPELKKIWSSTQETVIRLVAGEKPESEEPVITVDPPPPDPFETHGTLYSNGMVFKRYCGVEYDPLATVTPARNRMLINLETLRKSPGMLELVIRLLYSSLKP